MRRIDMEVLPLACGVMFALLSIYGSHSAYALYIRNQRIEHWKKNVTRFYTIQKDGVSSTYRPISRVGYIISKNIDNKMSDLLSLHLLIEHYFPEIDPVDVVVLYDKRPSFMNVHILSFVIDNDSVIPKDFLLTTNEELPFLNK